MGFVISMKFFSRFRMFAMLAAVLMAIGTRAEAQALALSASTSTNLVVVSNSVTYTINVTNLTPGSITVFVTNTFPASAQLLGASITVGAGITFTNANGFSFNNIPLNSGFPAQMTVTAAPTQTGLFTNTITVFVFDLTNAIANAVTLVTNAPSTPTIQADLAVAITGPASTVFTNDWMIYGVSVTNLGPDSASNVMLTNTLPPGVGYKTNSLALTRQGSDSNVVFSLGTLASNAFINFQLTVQPTNAGDSLPFSSFVNSTNVTDPNPANNAATIYVGVSNFLSSPGQLTASIVSTQKFDQLSGRLEQTIALSNAGPTSVDSARVIVTGLTNRLSNAVGTNNGNPFVTYASALPAGQSAYLLLQFFPTQIAFPFTNSQMQAVGVTPPNLTPAAGLMPTNIALMVKLPSGGILLAFNSLTNRTYTVEYTSNLLSPNWLAAQPPTVARANYEYWIDYGPPETVSHPASTPMRFYRLLLNP